MKIKEKKWKNCRLKSKIKVASSICPISSLSWVLLFVEKWRQWKRERERECVCERKRMRMREDDGRREAVTEYKWEREGEWKRRCKGKSKNVENNLKERIKFIQITMNGKIGRISVADKVKERQTESEDDRKWEVLRKERGTETENSRLRIEREWGSKEKMSL